MKRLGLAGVLLAVGLFTAATVAPAAESAVPQNLYLALGDSLAVGVGAEHGGYVPVVHEGLRDRTSPQGEPAMPDVQLVNAARSGETSESMVTQGQLGHAVALLEARNGNADRTDDVRWITLDIGGNDVWAKVPDCQAGFDQTCVTAVATALGSVQVYLDVILDQLREAAGPDATIVVLTYANSLAYEDCPYADLAPLAEVALEGGPVPGLTAGLNDIIRQAAAAHGAVVAEGYGAIRPDQFSDCKHVDDDGAQVLGDRVLNVMPVSGPAPVGLP